MRFSSTQNSRQSGEITVLALIETVLAMGTAIGIAVWTDTLLHIAIGACIAPLLLLRSPESISLGSRWLRAMIRRAPSRWTLFHLLVYSIKIRVCAPLHYPIAGVRSIGRNWKEIVLCTDMMSPVEVIPERPIFAILRSEEFKSKLYSLKRQLVFLLLGMGLVGCILGVSIYLLDFGIFKQDAAITEGVAMTLMFVGLVFLAWLLFIASGLLVFVTSITYRFSVKSTALLWLPMIYVVRATYDDSLSVGARAKAMTRSELWRIIRLVSWLTLIALSCKLLLLPSIMESWNRCPLSDVLNVYVKPDAIDSWHISATLNALIALIGYYFFIEKVPHHLKEKAWSTEYVERRLRLFTFSRGVISTYTIACLIGRTIETVLSIQLPVWGGCVLPWPL